MVATQVNSGDSGAGDHDYYFIKSLLEFKGTSTEHSMEGLSKKLGHSPMHNVHFVKYDGPVVKS